MKSDRNQEVNKLLSAKFLSKTDLEFVIKKGYVPGMSLAYIQNGKFAQALSIGVANIKIETPITDETIFWACSLSKPVFAYLVVKLIEDGTLPKNFLDLSLSKYLKSLSIILEYDQHFSQDASMNWRNALTAGMILEHETGLPNWSEKGTGDNVLNFKSEPGKEFTYSGEGFLYLQKVIEKVTNKSLNELADEIIFKPLGMNQSSFLYPEETKISTRYHDEAMLPITSPKNYGSDNNAAGSLHTTASDYALFLVASLNDKNFIEMINKLVNPIKDKEAVKKGVNKETLNHIYWYLGFGVQKINDEITLFHWGHGNGARNFFVMNMNTKSGLVFFTNSDNGLSIAPYMSTQIVGNLKYALNWLFIKEDYKDFDSLGWDKYHSAIIMESNEDCDGALALLKELKNLIPDDKQINNRIIWLETLNQIKTAPISVNQKILKKYEGDYDPLKITLNGVELELEENGKLHKLIPLNDSIFVDKESKVRITFDVEKDNIPNITCSFLDGKTVRFNCSTVSEKSSEKKQYSTTSTVALKLKMDLSDRIRDKVEQKAITKVEGSFKQVNYLEQGQVTSAIKEEDATLGKRILNC